MDSDIDDRRQAVDVDTDNGSADDCNLPDRIPPPVDRAETGSLTVFCPPGKSWLAYLGLALAGVYAEVIETPHADGYFYVASHTPIPISPIPLVYRG
jgi:hypothetical protein